MSKAKEMTDQGDLYVKRLRDRQLENSRSPDCYSKSLKRRLSIMEAIGKNTISPPTESNFGNNPFEREFSGSSFHTENFDCLDSSESRYPSTSTVNCTHGSSSRTPDGVRTYRVQVTPTITNTSIETTSRPAVVSPDKSLSPTHKNSNSTEIRKSKQPLNEFLAKVPEERDSEPGRSLNSEQKDPLDLPGCRLSRISMGEYFSRGPTHHGTPPQNFLGQIYNQNQEQNRQPEHRERTAPEMLFTARVLEILEPEVVHVNQQNAIAYPQQRDSEVTLARERFADIQSEDFSSTIATSFISENIRELDREIEALELHPDVVNALEGMRISTQQITPRRQVEPAAKTPQRQEQLAAKTTPRQAEPPAKTPPPRSPQVIAETPKRLYPDLEPLKRLSDKYTSRKLFHSNVAVPEENLESRTPMYSNQEIFPRKEIKKNDSEATVTPENESFFKTANSIPTIQKKNQENDHQVASTSSFIKRNMSFVVGHLPKFGRHHKPNLESTRKIGNNDNKTTSPGSMISTLTLPNTPSSPPTYTEKGRQNQFINVHGERVECPLPYEVENFLELALGDEQYNSTVTFDHPDLRDRTNSQLNASELMSYVDRTPVKSNFPRVTRVPMTEPPKHSTLNRTLTFYKTLTQRIKRKFRGSIKDEIRPLERTILPLDMNVLDDSVKRLLNIVELQQTYIYQASKALDLCSSMPEFAGSRERVESERQLLLATLRKAAAVEEIHRIARQRSEDPPCSERSEVRLCSLSLLLREEVLRRERQSGSLVEWYVVVINEGPFVWATEAVPNPENGSRLYFDGELGIPNLTPNFRITLRVYSLKLQQALYNHEEKYHIPSRSEDDSDMASTTCPSPNKLLRRSSVKRRSFVSSRQFDIRFSGIRESSFSLCGTVQLTVHDLNLSPPWPLIGVPGKSVLRGTVDMNFTHRLQLKASHTGFVTFGEEVAGLFVWNRRWCVLQNQRLLFWNYSMEQDIKNPICIIDLSYCASPRVSIVDRSLCAKPRTLLIETARRREVFDDRDSLVIERRTTRTVVRNLLSFDNHQDLMEWQSKLNYVVSALLEWNMLVN